MRRVDHHLFVSHVLKNASELAFSFLFVFVGYAANAQPTVETQPAVDIDPIVEYISQEMDHIASEADQETEIEVVDGVEQATDEFIVRLDEETTEETVQQIVAQSEHIEPVLHTEGDTFIKIDVPEDEKEQIIESLEENKDIEIEPNRVRRATAVPDDTSYSVQWHHNDSDAGVRGPTAWDTQTGSSDVVVAVIDSGVDTDHEDLADNMWVNGDEVPANGIDDDGNGFIDDIYGYDFIDDDGNPNPSPDGIDNDDYAGADTSVDHGSHVAGIIGAVGNNALGVTGVSWDVSIMAVKVLTDEGSGTDADIVQGIEYATANGADIINLSLGGYGTSNVLQDAIQEAAQSGVFIVAAAGNDGVSIQTNAFFPACYDSSVTAVSSIGATAVASSFSNFANGPDCVVDVAAPGELIYSTLYTDDPVHGFTDDYGFLTGTSMATPVVAGVAALLKAEDPTLNRASLTALIEDNARDIGLARKYGTGVVNAAASLAAIPEAHDPFAPTAIRAFTSQSRSTQFSSGNRSRNKTPFFTWSGASDIEGISGYRVYFGRDKNADPATEGMFQITNTYQASGVTGNGTKYYLRVKTVDTDDNISDDVASFTYIVDTKLPKPKRVRVEQVETGVRVRWKKVKRQHVYRYVVRRSVNGKRFKKIKRLKRRKRSYVDTRVKPGKTYRYRIRVIDDVRNKRTSKAAKIRL